MKPIAIAIFSLCLMHLTACTNQRTDQSDEVSMALYRDCMNAMPQGPDPHHVSGALSSSGGSQPASVSAAVNSNAQAQKETDCAHEAGWK